MRRPLLILIVLGGIASADGLPYGKGPCDDVDACERACARDAAACTWGGDLLLRSGLDTGKARAAALFERACAKGHAEGCWRAGLLADPGYRDGHEDRRKARAFYDRACARGLVRGCFALAKLDGATGDDRARRAAAAALRRAMVIEDVACGHDDAQACDEAAQLAAQLVPPDDKHAALDRDRACRIRRGVACNEQTPAERRCQAEAARADAALHAADAANERRYEEALARAHLQPVHLVAHVGAPPPADPLARSWRVDHVVELPGRGGAPVRVVVAPPTWSSHCIGGGGPAIEYVARGDQIFRAVPAPHAISRQDFTLCGCGPVCGGAAPAAVQGSFELPPGTTFAGPIDIAYDSDEVSRRYVGAGMCAGPPRAASPPRLAPAGGP